MCVVVGDLRYNCMYFGVKLYSDINIYIIFVLLKRYFILVVVVVER